MSNGASRGNRLFNRFLTCGDLTFGFACICCDCGTTRLLTFSCKGRYFFPSCNAKKVRIFGEFVQNEVAEAVLLNRLGIGGRRLSVFAACGITPS